MADVEMKPEEGLQKRGRGFNEEAGDAMDYDTVQTDSTTSGNAARSVEGWIIIVTNVHEEASEEDLMDLFSDFGKVQNMHLNLDRRTGYVKGYALIEYATKKEADAAVQGANDTEFLEQTIHVGFAFVKPPAGAAAAGRGARPAGRNGATGGSRRRSVSPQARV